MDSDPSDAAGFDAPTVHRRRVLQAAAGLGTAAVVGTGTAGFGRAQESDAGAERWQFDVPLDAFSSPTVVDGSVFVGTVGIGDRDFSDSEGLVRALDAETGDERWQTQVGTEILSSPTVDDGTLFVGCWYDDGEELGGRLVALDAGVDGSSDGSRVTLGTLGHHGGWRYADQPIDAVTPAGPATDSPTGTASESATGTSTDGTRTDGESADGGQDDGAQTDAVGPGFGPASALAGLGGAAALLGRRFADDERDAR